MEVADAKRGLGCERMEIEEINLTEVFCESPSKTAEWTLSPWSNFWSSFCDEDIIRYSELDIRAWLLEYMAFSNDGARVIAR